MVGAETPELEVLPGTVGVVELSDFTIATKSCLAEVRSDSADLIELSAALNVVVELG